MPQQSWSDKRERQYEHIKKGLEERGDSESLSEEIAARTVNKERARAERPGSPVRHRSRTSRPAGGVGSGPTAGQVVAPGTSSTEKRARRASRVDPR